MAITIKQSPSHHSYAGSINMLNSNIVPLFSTWEWTSAPALYSDFTYHVKYVDNEGDFLFTTIGEDDSNWSKLSVNDLLKNKLDNVFQPKSIHIAKNINAIGNYRLDITPFNNGSLDVANSGSTFASFSIKASKEDWFLTDFLKTTSSNMLVDVDHHYYTQDTYATNKALYGHFGYSYGSTFGSIFTKIVYEVTKSNGTIETYELANNLPLISPSGDFEVINADDMLVEIPTAPKNLSKGFYTLAKITLLNGYTFYPTNMTHINLSNGDTYRYAAYNDDARVSKWYNITVRNCTTRYTPMPISWLTENGAYDTFVAYAKNEKKISVKNKTYSKEKYKRVGDYYYVNSENNREETVYDQDVKEVYEIITDWITDEDVKSLESLWASPDINIQIEGVHYPVVSVTNNVIINNKDNVKLFKYNIQLQLSNKKYRL